MNESWNPEIPLDLQQNFKKEKEQAFTLYLDFVVDATASMYTVFPAVYYAAAHFLECLSKYEVYPQIGLTLIRNEENGEETETVLFEGRDSFTSDISLFLKKLKGTKLYGGGDDGKNRCIKQSELPCASFLFREEIRRLWYLRMRMEVMTMRNTHSIR